MDELVLVEIVDLLESTKNFTNIRNFYFIFR